MSKRYPISLVLLCLSMYMLNGAEFRGDLLNRMQDNPDDTPNASLDGRTPDASMSETELTIQEICASIRKQISSNPSSIDIPLNTEKTYIWTCFNDAIYVTTNKKDFESYKELIEFLLKQGANLNVKDSDVYSLLNRALADKNNDVKLKAKTLRPLITKDGSEARTKQEFEAEIERKKKDAEAEIERKKKDAEAEIERKKKEADAEIELQKKIAESEAKIKDAEAEIERKRGQVVTESAQEDKSRSTASGNSSIIPSVLFAGTIIGIGIIAFIHFQKKLF